MIVLQINELPGLSGLMSKTFGIVRLLAIEAKLSIVVHRFYGGKEVIDKNQGPIHGFILSNSRFYTKSFIDNIRKNIPDGVKMVFGALTIRFSEIDQSMK